MKSIAIFLPNWIGDVVMATPAIRAIRSHFAHVGLLAVCKPYVSKILSGSTWFDETILFDRNGPREFQSLSVINRLRKAHCDTAVLFPNSFRAALLARAAGCQTVVGFARYFRDALLSHRLYPTRNRHGGYKPVPVIDDYNRIAQLLGIPSPGYEMELHTTPNEESDADAVWNQFGLQRFRQIIGLNPGGAYGAAKHWPVEYFAKLANQCADRGAGVVVLCGPAEREIARAIVNQSQRSEVVGYSDIPLSLGLTKATIRRLTLLVTTDSGPRHIAAAFKIPVVTLFGPTHIGWTETYYPKAIHLQKAVPCGPCQQRICPLGHHRCMTELSPEEVYQAAEHLWARFAEGHRHAG